ncbi:MAG TPA: hypothetical protein PK443_04680 [bacterium]|nr:hypothetical protein [bacterium]
MFRFIFFIAVGLFFLNTLNAQLSAVKRSSTSDKNTNIDAGVNNQDAAKKKNNIADAVSYETYYNANGEKEIRAYKYASQIKGQKEAQDLSKVQYEQTQNSNGESATTAYKWSFQDPEQVGKVKLKNVEGGSLSYQKSAPASTNTTSAPEPEEDASGTPPQASDELKTKILDMIRSQQQKNN